MSARTIERDVGSLQLAGVPIYADYGAAGGYSILQDYSLPPLNLSAAESLATLAGLALLESSPYQTAARRARAKIAAVMKHEHRGSVQKMLETTYVIDAGAPTNDTVPLGILSAAIAAGRLVRLTYLGENDDGSRNTTLDTDRDVETLGLLRAADAWLLIGWCRLRGGIRGFRVDRITRLEIRNEVPPVRDPALLEDDLARWPTRCLI